MFQITKRMISLLLVAVLALSLFAGCGIVAGSNPTSELAETWSKFRPMLEALDLDRAVGAVQGS